MCSQDGRRRSSPSDGDAAILASQLRQCADLVERGQSSNSSVSSLDPILLKDTLKRLSRYCSAIEAAEKGSLAEKGSISSLSSVSYSQKEERVTQDAPLPSPKENLGFHLGSNLRGTDGSSIIAYGWIQQKRRMRSRVTWKWVWATLVKVVAGADETDITEVNTEMTLCVYESPTSRMLHSFLVHWMGNIHVVRNDNNSADYQFSFYMKMSKQEFVFQCPHDPVSAQTWILALSQAQHVAEMDPTASSSVLQWQHLERIYQMKQMVQEAGIETRYVANLKELKRISAGLRSSRQRRRPVMATVAESSAGTSSSPSQQEPTRNAKPTTKSTPKQPSTTDTTTTIATSTMATTGANAAVRKNERIQELRKVAHGAGIHTSGMTLDGLENSVAQRTRQFDAATHRTTATNKERGSPSHTSYPPMEEPHQAVEPKQPETNAETNTPPLSSVPTINWKKERIKELRKLAHGARINTRGMELDELERVITHLSQQHSASLGGPTSTATSQPSPGTTGPVVGNDTSQTTATRGPQMSSQERQPTGWGGVPQNVPPKRSHLHTATQPAPRVQPQNPFLDCTSQHQTASHFYSAATPPQQSHPHTATQPVTGVQPRNPFLDHSSQHQTANQSCSAAFSPPAVPDQGVASRDLQLKRAIFKQWALQPPAYQDLRPIAKLLASIHKVIPPGALGHEHFRAWAPISAAEVSSPAGVEHVMRKIRFVLHEDRLPPDLTREQKFVCRLLWDITSDAFEDFNRKSSD